MRIAVVGLWHTGAVLAATLVERGCVVVGTDPDPDAVASLASGEPLVAEPGLAALVQQGLTSTRLSFAGPPDAVCADADVVWVACDTAIDDEDRGHPEPVVELAVRCAEVAPPACLLVLSSQLPAGSAEQVRRTLGSRGRPDVRIAVVPENLRVGRALAAARDRHAVVGCDQGDRALLQHLVGDDVEVEWMSPTSAEVAKHALNAHLATSIALANEVATVCEAIGADAAAVARALRADPRIGPAAYVVPGGPFAGGTLGRDLGYLASLGEAAARTLPVVAAVPASNAAHAGWPLARLDEHLAPLAGKVVAVLGLAYVAGTDTLRRSWAVELVSALVARGVQVRTFDPLVVDAGHLPPGVEVAATAVAAAVGADAVVVATAAEEVRALGADALAGTLLVDPAACLDHLASDPRIVYRAVGRPVPATP